LQTTLKPDNQRAENEDTLLTNQLTGREQNHVALTYILDKQHGPYFEFRF